MLDFVTILLGCGGMLVLGAACFAALGFAMGPLIREHNKDIRARLLDIKRRRRELRERKIGGEW